MARYTTSVQTPLAAPAAFAYMADVTHFAEWDPGVVRVSRVVGDGASVGSAYDLWFKTVGTTLMRYVVTEYDAPRRVLLTARTRLVTSVDEIRVAPSSAGEGSLVTYDAVLTLNGPLRVFDSLLDAAFQRIGDRAAVGLRRVLGAPAGTS
ncbi:MAG: SRPBCC family protein [Myxococcota bacterium]